MTVRTHVLRWSERGGTSEIFDELAAEEPLEIRIGGEAVSVTMRTPGHDQELVAGLLLSESLIAAGDRPLLRLEKPNVINVGIDAECRTARHGTIVSASCGLCGKASIEAIHQHFPRIGDSLRISHRKIQRMMEIVAETQPGFARTGGVHAAGIFDSQGDVVVVREDVGRHNAVDKAIGHALLRGLLPLAGHTLVVSGRSSFEIIQKALGARIPVIAAVSAPSSLAVDLAEESEQTLLGFVRKERCNIYTHPERILFD